MKRPTRLSLTRTFAILMVVAATTSSAALPVSAATPEDSTVVYTLLPPGTNPEGIAFDRRTNSFFVGAIGDGTVYRGRADRRVWRPFLPAGQNGRTEALGLEVDDNGRLYIAGGSTGKVFVYDISSRELVAKFDTGEGGFINDLTITRTGDVYATDSFRPFLYRISPQEVAAGGGPVTAIPVSPEIRYVEGFNLNGIAPFGHSVIVVNSATGKLFRITPRGGVHRRIVEIEVMGGSLRTGDGLERAGRHLFVVRNGPELVADVELEGFARRGEVLSMTGDPTFMTPTTVALAHGRLFVVNSEFVDTDGPPFTVSSIPRP